MYRLYIQLCVLTQYCTEPGYYEDGAFGIRIENVELIKEVETKYCFGGAYLTMEPLTLVGSTCDLRMYI